MLSEYDVQGIAVTLSPEEVREAIEFGEMATRDGVEKGRKDKAKVGKNPGVWIMGALGECAVAKALGVPWEKNFNTFKDPDVGPFQVRCSPLYYGGLIFRQEDNPDEIFILVTKISRSEFVVRGWATGHKCRSYGEYTDFGRTDRDKCHCLHQDDLNPMSKLKELAVCVDLSSSPSSSERAAAAAAISPGF